MSDKDLIQALRGAAVETGSLLCLGCGYEHSCGTRGCAIIRAAAERLEALTAPPNAPLTLEELREMDGEPVWCVDGSGNKRWVLVHVYGDNPDEFECYTALYGRIPGWCYGMEGGSGWLAYRRKPEEA